MGGYLLVCDWCNRSIRQSWVCAWFPDDPKPQTWVALHRKWCLAAYLEMNNGREVMHKGSPYFKLDIPYMGDRVVLGEEAKNFAAQK